MMNPPLTERGVQQAEQMANRMRVICFDAIYCSDLTRAVSTAEALSLKTNTSVIQHDALREIDMGALTLQSWSDFPETFALWSKHEEDIPYPNGENGQMVWERCEPLLHSIVRKELRRVALVSHGGTIRSIIAGVTSLPQQHRFRLGCPLDNCSVSILRYQGGHFFLHTLNES